VERDGSRCRRQRSRYAVLLGVLELGDALDVMSGIEAEYAERTGEDSIAELKRLLARLLDEIDPAGGLRTE
jgi:hypothetical protein